MDDVTRDRLVDTIRADRAAFDAIVDTVPPERLSEPMLDGGWSVRDVLAHIAWGDREAVGVVRSRALVGSPLWQVSEDVRNETVIREARARRLEAVLEDYRSSFEDYLAAISSLSDDELNDPSRIAGLPERIPDWPPWRVLYDPGHYADHGTAIRRAFPISRGTGSGSTPRPATAG